MRLWEKLKKQPWANAAIAACIGILFYVIVTNLPVFGHALATVYDWIRPIVMGGVIAYVLNPLTRWFEHHLFKHMHNRVARRSAATWVTVIVMVLLIVILMWLLIPQLVDSVKTFVANIGNYSAALDAMLSGIGIQGGLDLSNLVDNYEEFLYSLVYTFTDNMSSAAGVAAGIGSNVVDVALAVVLAVYFLADKQRMKSLLKKVFRMLLSEQRFDQFSDYFRRSNEIFVRFIAFDLLDGFLVGLVNCLFMLIAGIPYSVLISVVVGVTNLAPTFGPIVGALIGALILVLVNPWYALWFLIFTVVLQIVDGYILKPKLFGGSLGVPAIWILITLIVGGRMLGVLGLLLAIPFAAIFISLGKELFPKFFGGEEVSELKVKKEVLPKSSREN